MSRFFSGKIKKKCIDEDLLEDIFLNFFSSGYTLIKEIRKERIFEKRFYYEGITESHSMCIVFADSADCWDCEITNKDFEYEQSISFHIHSEDCTIDMTKMIIDFFITLKQNIDSDILVTSEIHDDICLLKEREIIWAIDSETGNRKNVWFGFSDSGN